MTVELIPLPKFSNYYARGWRIYPGYDLRWNDWAATMVSPDHVWAPAKSNLTRGSESGRHNRTLACTVDGCDAPHHAKGYCRKHFARWDKHGDVTVVAKSGRKVRAAIAGVEG